MKPKLAEYRRVRVDRIMLPNSKEPNETNVQEIAESMLVHGLITPLTVRELPEAEKDGKTNSKIVLISGKDRLAAAKLNGAKRVSCILVNCDDIDAKLIEISENLWRKRFPAIERAEMLVEWMTLASAHLNVSGQPVRKGRPGRPPSGFALAARKLPVVGRTEEARRKILERATKIASLPQEIKDAARREHLDNNQRALLAIAKCKNIEAQHRRIRDLSSTRRSTNALLASSTKLNVVSAENGDQADGKGRPSKKVSRNKRRQSERSSSLMTPTTLLDLRKAWDSAMRALWRDAPADVRAAFIESVRRAKSSARPDIGKFLARIFQGRHLFGKHEVKALAAASGLSVKAVLRDAKLLGYHSKRKGHGAGAKWYFINKDSEWKNRIVAVKPEEITAGVEAYGDRISNPERDLHDPPEDDYYVR